MPKTSYCAKWEDEFNWLTKSSKPDCGYCNLCKDDFRIDGSGVSQVKSHQKSKARQKREKSVDKNRRKFVFGKKKTLELSSGSFDLSLENKIQKAEILQALKVVNSNYSFASCDGDGERFAAMFPDSEIAIWNRTLCEGKFDL